MISLITAVDRQGQLGLNGRLPWRSPATAEILPIIPGRTA